MDRAFLKASIVAIICIALMSCQTAPNVKDRQRAQDFAMRAQNLLTQGKFGDAVSELEEALKLDPESSLLNQQMGRALALNGQYPEAQRYLNRALRLDPNDPATHGHLAMMYYKQGDFKKSLESNLKAHQMIPEDPYYYFAIGNCYDKLSDGTNAHRYFSMYLSEGDDDSWKKYIVQWMKQTNMEVPPFQSGVIALLEEKKFSEVEEYLKGLQKSKLTDENGESELTKAYRDIRKMKDARVILKEWEEKNPKSAFALGLLGSAFIDFAWEARGTGYLSSVTTSAQQTFEERIKQAKNYLKEASELDPSNLQTAHDLMLASKAIKSTWLEVKPIFDAATRQEPDNFLIQKQMLESLAPKWGGTVSEMMEFARSQAVKSAPSSKSPILVPMAHWEIAFAYYDQNLASYFGKKSVWEECKQALDTAVLRFPKSVEIRTLYLRTAYYAGAMKEARAQYDEIKTRMSMRYWVGGYPEIIQVKRGLASAP